MSPRNSTKASLVSATPLGFSVRTTALQAGGGVRWSITSRRHLQPYQVLAGSGRGRIELTELIGITE